MKTSFGHPFIQVSEKELAKMHEFYKLDAACLEESAKSIMAWCKQQGHLSDALPYIAKTFCIQRCLLLCSGSIELCKRRIDKIVTARSLIPDLTLNRRTPDEFRELLSHINLAMLPRQVPSDFSAVIITQIKNEYPDNFCLLTYFRYMVVMAEYRIYYQYGIALRVVIDLKNVPAKFLFKFNPVLVRKIDFLSTQCYGSKLKGIHILNAPTFVDKFVEILKLVLKPKLGERVYVHNDYEDLRKHIPKDILPTDFGGDERSCSELSDSWFEQLSTKESQRMIADFDNVVADESKRNVSRFNEEYMGTPGSFKQLQVD